MCGEAPEGEPGRWRYVARNGTGSIYQFKIDHYVVLLLSPVRYISDGLLQYIT